jgi:cardiolipin synthase (CMP-forming)
MAHQEAGQLAFRRVISMADEPDDQFQIETEETAPQAPPPESLTLQSMATMPNMLTLARLVLLPVILWGIRGNHPWMAALMMLIVLITDLLDGRLARRLGQASAFGKSLDSTIDFVLIYCLFIGFWVTHHIPTYQFAFIYVAMLTIFLTQLVGTAGGEEGIVKTVFGKPTGALQYAYLLFLVAAGVMPNTPGVATFGLLLFGALAVLIVFNTIECISLLKKGV